VAERHEGTARSLRCVATIVRDEPVETGGDSPQRRRRVAAVFAACLLFAGAVGGWRWWHDSPEVFGEGGGGYAGPAEIGQAFNVGDVWPTRLVEVISMEAVLAEGSATAAVSSNLCEPAEGPLVGSALGWLTVRCTALQPVVDVEVGPELRDGYILVTVIPLEAGTVIVEGFRITYRDGWRTFTDVAGPRVELTVSA
jgi:hypothetical protein